MATDDGKSTPRDMFAKFSCATGIALTPELAPKTAALLPNERFDTAQSASPPRS
ncbi:hypothetical protein SPHINGO361_140319 [Sphingomonas sp. EC-HK361]|uniref:hypothetical protein n=1 Tax=Sphingomonas sp. EC-HK361 TaxID=2038397 RepID=UPI00125A799A|nr:hypothetical protein [Sphingomonas sp. EC-HK361]VVT18771.1 hypothetical protein SPHINGO361_140319 [Sphingomonas sp. EC-HK361]